LNEKNVQVIRIHQEAFATTRWIGVDLNTTGHVAVLAEPETGKVLKLGKNTRQVRSHTIKDCTKLYKEGKLWKLKRFNTRERKDFRATVHKISRQIVSFAESLCSGIKFEKLFPKAYPPYHKIEGTYEFSFENGSFFTLQHLVEIRAHSRGVPVIYVDPTNTSKRCSVCGAFGRRFRKRFECPHCGNVAHADVNAAFNIATTPHHSDRTEVNRLRHNRKKIRLLAGELYRVECSSGNIADKGHPVLPQEYPCRENILAVLQ
jgi:putative transposase